MMAFTLKAALGVAVFGSLLRLLFFKSIIAILETFVLLFFAWFICGVVFMLVLRNHFAPLYELLLKLPLTANSTEQENTEDMDKAAAAANNVDGTTGILGSTADIPDELQQTQLYNVKRPQAKATKAKSSSAQQRRSRKPEDSDPLTQRELTRLKQFDSKDIAKAVKMMLGPDEDNPLLKQNAKAKPEK